MRKYNFICGRGGIGRRAGFWSHYLGDFNYICMEIFNFKKSEKILFLIFTMLFICLFILCIYELIFNDFDTLTLILFIIFAITSIASSIISLIAFSSKTILLKSGLIYKTIFKSSFHNWNDMNFVAAYELTLRYTPINGIICSFDLEKDEIKCSHFARVINNKHYLCFPYSEETKNFLISNLPYGKYLGLAFTDESFNKI